MAHTPTVIITTAEAARRLGVSRERVRQLLKQGTLAGFRIEGRARARYVDLNGEGSEDDRVLVSTQEGAPMLQDEYVDNQKMD